MKPSEVKGFENRIEAHRAAAIKKNGKLHRVHPGYYLIRLNNELVELDRMSCGPHTGEWIAREVTKTYFSRWYSDPQPTLRELKNHLGMG